VVLDTQLLLEPKRESDAGAEALDEFGRYVQDPLDSTVLVLVADTLDGRKALTKLLLKQATVVQCQGVSDDRGAQRWLEDQVRESGRRIDREAVLLLVDRAGVEIARLRSELERVLLYVGDRKAVTVSDVEAVAGAATAHGDWAVTNALQAGNLETALRELALALDGGAFPVMVLGQLAWWVRTRLQPAPRVPAAVRALLEIGRTAPGWNPARAGGGRR
jgi:DNA polymerase-3 subunit delta